MIKINSLSALLLTLGRLFFEESRLYQLRFFCAFKITQCEIFFKRHLKLFDLSFSRCIRFIIYLHYQGLKLSIQIELIVLYAITMVNLWLLPKNYLMMCFAALISWMLFTVLNLYRGGRLFRIIRGIRHVLILALRFKS